MLGTAEAWALVQAAELVRASDVVLLHGIALLHGVSADMPEDEEVVLSGGEVAEIARLGEVLVELAGQLQALVEQLPDGGVHVTHADVAEGAREDLTRGIIDPLRLLLAARVLPAGAGWQALARGLRTTDTHAAWTNMTVDELLGRFRGADDTIVRRVLAAAELPADLAVTSCGDCDMALLAAALEEHAPDGAP